ncbi:pectinesterase family protein [Mucilaginibacter paludis]|uniref:Pectinesterase n=1 Tax=Mucilaginibacter paludis DSM 18603 TaxID=714943 RepID=H1Y275_9SPHI|nr:pectinesterase family protein [Mucilaginibacter paludis]EHQ26732.1 Pectinesterase [Mucilaginibacter paludis DSM 18603]
MKKISLFTLLLFVFARLTAQGPVYPKELTVAPDGSGNYKTIQEAVNSVRDFGQRVIIHIKKGIYHEKLVIPAWKTQISLVGEDKVNTVITNNDYSGKPNPGGKDAFGKPEFTTYTSYTVLVQGDDFTAENLTIENTAGRVGQAVALDVEADRCKFINCRFLGNQDTLYLSNENSRQYYQNCYIEGTTDFIFGEATCVFQSCTIKSLTPSFATAASTTARQKYGFVFFDCKLIADTSVHRAYLGRPWRSYAKTVYIRTEIGGHIAPEGWNPWKGDAMFPDKFKTAYYAEYKNTGPGADTKKRVEWAHRLTDREAKEYTLANIFAGNTPWDPLNH